MAEQKESSVLFSLKELMSLEEDRIKQEDEERKRRAEAEIQAKLDADRRAREQEQARLQAEENRRREEEQRKKEDQARLEAIRHAEVEKARVEAENRARMEALAKQQEHERQLHSLKHDDHKKKLQRMVTFSIAGAAIVIIGGLGLYMKSKSEGEAREAATRAALLQKDEESKRFQKQLEEQTTKVNELLQQLSSAQDEKTRAELKAKLAEAQKQQQNLQQRGGNAAPAKADSPAPKKACNCQPGDPLCSCL